MAKNKENTSDHFARNLKFLMKQTNTTQFGLADLTGRGQTSVGNWMNGINQPKYDILLKICDFFGVTTYDILQTDISESGIIDEKFLKKFDAKNPYKKVRIPRPARI